MTRPVVEQPCYFQLMAEGDRLLTQNPAFDVHVRQAVNRGQFSTDPFPYLFVTDLVPPSLYAQLAEAWPLFEEMSCANPTIGRVDIVDPGPKRFDVVPIEKTSLSPQQVNAWREFRALINGAFFEEAFTKFKPHLKEHGRELLAPLPTKNVRLFDRIFRKRPDLSFWKNATPSDFIPREQFLVNRKDLSVLSPHIDPPRFHFTLIFYFAPDLERQHLGTTLFRQTAPGRARLPSETEYLQAQYAVHYDIPCEQACALPFRPNAALLFLNGLHSWHGQHLSESIERRTYNSFFTARAPDIAMRRVDMEKLRQHKII